MRDRLDALVEAELLVATGHEEGERFIFKHALIQEAAYQSLLRSTRNEHHERVARALVGQFADTTAGRPEMVAYHLTQAGQAAASIPHWMTAGQAAMGRSANLDAVSHLTTALEQLATLPESPQRSGQELGLRVLTAVPMTLTRGWANPEVGEMYERAAELTETVGEVPELFPTRVGVLDLLPRSWAAFHGLRAGGARSRTRRSLRGDRFPDRGGAGSRDHLASPRQRRGNPGHILERAAALYDAPRHHPHVFMYGKDPGAVAMVHLSGVLWQLGEPDRGLAMANAARALSETWFHPFSALWTGVGQAFSHQVRGDAPAVAKVADWIVSESVEQVFPNWLAQGQVFLGWALAAMGQGDRGIEMMKGGLALWEMTGAELFRTYLLSLLADGLRIGGDAEGALAVVETALAVADRTDERFWEAELRRVRGDLLLETGADEATADAEHVTALGLARSRSQRSLEPRAATSRARRMRAGGDGSGVEALLRPILEHFPEQTETRDIAAATALLTGAEDTRPHEALTSTSSPPPPAQPPKYEQMDLRDRLGELLVAAAELEHGVVCQYLFAAFSMKRHPDEGNVSWEQLELMRGWEADLLLISRQEMEHLGLVANLLTAIGEAPDFLRPPFPIPSDFYPHHDRPKSERFGPDVLKRLDQARATARSRPRPTSSSRRPWHWTWMRRRTNPLASCTRRSRPSSGSSTGASAICSSVRHPRSA